MSELIEKVGTVHRVTACGDLRIQYPGKPEAQFRWTLHPDTIAKVRKCFQFRGF
jgi:hypothetical protein